MRAVIRWGRRGMLATWRLSVSASAVSSLASISFRFLPALAPLPVGGAGAVSEHEGHCEKRRVVAAVGVSLVLPLKLPLKLNNLQSWRSLDASAGRCTRMCACRQVSLACRQQGDLAQANNDIC